MKQYKTPKLKVKNVALSDNISFLVSGQIDNSAKFNSSWDPGKEVDPSLLIDPKYWD